METCNAFIAPYQTIPHQADLVFRGMFDSNYNVGSVLEKKLQPLPFTFMLSAFLAHGKPTYRFGFGLMVG